MQNATYSIHYPLSIIIIINHTTVPVVAISKQNRCYAHNCFAHFFFLLSFHPPLFLPIARTSHLASEFCLAY
ncbi:hypothetical protein HOY82DRAFT_567250 [Tuber indicum]|nr:hypothetical protein HOY82DRAFT_567250 [Tuber indicum]